jgi:hypothetical protein
MHPKHQPSPQPRDTQFNVHNAALHGASLAFSKPPSAPGPIANTYTGGSNGALVAATKVGTQWTGGSTRSSRSTTRPSLSPMQAGSRPSSFSSSTLGLPEDDRFDRETSPSNIAARLAAARHSPLRPTTMSERHANETDVLPPSGSVGSVLARLESAKPSQPPRGRRDSLASKAVEKPHKPADYTPVPTTTSMAHVLQEKPSATLSKSAAAPPSIARRSPPLVRSPKPQRVFRLPPEPRDDAPPDTRKTQPPPTVQHRPKHRIELPSSQFIDGAQDGAYFTTPRKDPMKSPPIKQKPAKLAALRTGTPPPKSPPQREQRNVRPQSAELPAPTPFHRRFSTSVESEKAPSSPSSFKSAQEQQVEEEKLKPTVPPPRRSNTRKPETAAPASRPRSTAPTPVPPRRNNQLSSPGRPLERSSPPRRPLSAAGTSPGSVYHNPYQRDSVKQITKHMTGESLSSAIMGAALASSRNVSPAPSQPIAIEPLFPPRRQHHHHSLLRRSPSPPKQSPPKSAGKLRTTLRREPSSSEDEDEVERYKKKGTRILGFKGRKHPNKHHEGTRNRWRDQITERERKRYEGVWAANKGLFLPAPVNIGPERAPPEDDPSLDVLNLVVQDIWTRSRLPTHVLEEVWDLVDSRAIGRLKRIEFVVGLWLIDQRLKGRKLPVKVGGSVWTSARGVGIKVKVHR